MGYIAAIVSIVGESVGKVLDKLNFSKSEIASEQQVILVFAAMCASLSVYLAVSRQAVPGFSPAAYGLVILIILVSAAGNQFDYHGLRGAEVSFREPISNFSPLLAGAFGYFLFPSERKTLSLLALALGCIVLYWGVRGSKEHAPQRRAAGSLFAAMALYAALPVLYKLALTRVTPEYIAAFRALGVLLISGGVAEKGLDGLTIRTVARGVGAGVLYAIAAIAQLYAIQLCGLLTAMLLLLTGPALRYALSHVLLRERLQGRRVLASISLLILVVAVALYG